MDDHIFIYIALVPLLGMLAQLIAWWLRIPSILLLLTFGVVLGFWMSPDKILAFGCCDSVRGWHVVAVCRVKAGGWKCSR